MRAKTFLQVSIGILVLALAYHFGATSAGAQAGYNPVVAAVQSNTSAGSGTLIIASNGDVYASNSAGTIWTLLSNVFTGPPTPVQPTSFGALKARYR